MRRSALNDGPEARVGRALAWRADAQRGADCRVNHELGLCGCVVGTLQETGLRIEKGGKAAAPRRFTQHRASAARAPVRA